MLIPVRCFTCGKVLGDKWEYYEKKSNDLKNEQKEHDSVSPIDKRNIAFYEQYGTKNILDDLGLVRLCCRRHMLGHVDLIENI